MESERVVERTERHSQITEQRKSKFRTEEEQISNRGKADYEQRKSRSRTNGRQMESHRSN